VAKFFPKTEIVDFNNITLEAIAKQRIFNISPTILTEEISKLINNLLNGKALGLDGILNKIFKIVVLVIIEELAKVASCYFASRTLLKSLKESTTIVLCKEGKKNYSLLGSYRPITLKNMLVKVFKKYIVNIMAKAAKEYRLFSWN